VARILAGLLRKIDRDRAEVTIGPDTLAVLPGVSVPRDLKEGAVVTAVLVEQNGTLLIAGLRPSTAPTLIVRAS
jgi:hypothetical protein